MDRDRQSSGPALVRAPFVMVALMVALLAVTLLMWAAFAERLLWPFLMAVVVAAAALGAVVLVHLVRARRSTSE